MLTGEIHASFAPLKDVFVVPENVRKGLRMREAPWFSDSYNADQDFRLTCLFSSPGLTIREFRKFLTEMCFGVISNISLEYMKVPTDEQMQDLLGIGGFTQEQMEEYLMDGDAPDISCIPDRRYTQIICLFTRVMAEALYLRTAWNCGREAFRPYPDRLDCFIEYMEESGLLRLDTDDFDDFDNFRQEICLLTGVREIIRAEGAALAFTLGILCTGPGSENFLTEHISPEMFSVTEDGMNRREKLNQVWQDCAERSEFMEKECLERLKDLLTDCSVHYVSSGMLQSLLIGDGFFRSAVGMIVVNTLLRISDMPVSDYSAPTLIDRLRDTGVRGEGRMAPGGGPADLPDLLMIPVDSMEFADPLPLSLLEFLSRDGYRTDSDGRRDPHCFPDSICSPILSKDFDELAVLVSATEYLIEKEDEYERRNGSCPPPVPGTPEKEADARAGAAEQRAGAAEAETEESREETETPGQRIGQPEAEQGGKAPESRDTSEPRQDRKEEKQQRSESSAAGEVPPSNASGTVSASPASPSFRFPFRTDLKMFVCGGSDEFRRDLVKLFPDVRTAACTTPPDRTDIRDADLVFMQTSFTGLPRVFSETDRFRSHRTWYCFLSYSDVRKCVEYMEEERLKTETSKPDKDS